MTFEVRDATPADAAQVTRVHQRSREAYYGDALDRRDAAQDRYPMWLATLTRPGTWCLVAEQDGHVAGFIAAHLADRGSPAELSSLYVDPDRFGSGIGTALHTRFIEVVPSGTAELEVWDGNERAKRFYAVRGWRPTTRTRAGVAGRPFVTWRLDVRRGSRSLNAR
ncbi:GNAT family N-acetyltransferase [Curtobacterium sp. MCBD17_008]|uniref:GNAT family N-acetyltransferase n=1 Tax=Curtobacterium sp. MCBD17_008 TaxID=2175656 RepID=UPI000DAA134E|nr:GNAT family N-acetyltransferase [Curtobacterium sp. MCBD17_008]PZE93378.1 GNAT family N-acetyltransferase [Curtobacterium sp. MCBD17_008]